MRDSDISPPQLIGLQIVFHILFCLIQNGSDSRSNNIGHLKLSGFKYTEMLASQQCDNNDVVACGNAISKHTSKIKITMAPFPY